MAHGFPEVVVLPDGFEARVTNRQEMDGEVGFSVAGALDAAPTEVAAALEFEDVGGYRISCTVNETNDATSAVVIGVDPAD